MKNIHGHEVISAPFAVNVIHNLSNYFKAYQIVTRIECFLFFLNVWRENVSVLQTLTLFENKICNRFLCRPIKSMPVFRLQSKMVKIYAVLKGFAHRRANCQKTQRTNPALDTRNFIQRQREP